MRGPPPPVRARRGRCAAGPGVACVAEACSQEQSAHREPAVTVWQCLGTSQFWFESMQNWQSEFVRLPVRGGRRHCSAPREAGLLIASFPAAPAATYAEGYPRWTRQNASHRTNLARLPERTSARRVRQDQLGAPNQVTSASRRPVGGPSPTQAT
ncbi:MAG TPA: DUF6766 family protein [Microlunatus sp.]|nr:DUF6766 family protein [Microlunatus sp.]